MAETLQDRLYEIFAAIAGEQTRFPEPSAETTQTENGSGTEERLTDSTAAATRRSSTGLAQVNSSTTASGASAGSNDSVLGEIQQALSSDPVTSLVTGSLTGLISSAGGIADAVKQSTEDGGGVAKTLESIASTVFTSGFGLVSLVGGLFGLFGGGDQEQPPPLVKYALPQSIDYQAAETANGIGDVDYDQSGLPRAISSGGTQSDGTAAQTITVNVQALDARSFLDRSNDIAAAVRDAMLNLNSINDVVNDL